MALCATEERRKKKKKKRNAEKSSGTESGVVFVHSDRLH